MKLWWTKLAARIDALSLRERAFLFISLIACCLALADVLWITPAQNAYQQTTQRYAAQVEELKRLRAELQTTGQVPDSRRELRDETAALDARMAKLNQLITDIAPLADKGPNLEQVLVQFLRRHEGLTLLSTGTLKAEPALASGAPEVSANPVGMTKRGMELRVRGPYAELVRYVRSLETALLTLRWGQLQLKSDTQPPELTLQVYVVGVAP